MVLGSLPNWTLHEYLRESVGLMDVKGFDAMDVDGKVFVAYDRSYFDCNAALAAWKRRWVVLS